MTIDAAGAIDVASLTAIFTGAACVRMRARNERVSKFSAHWRE